MLRRFFSSVLIFSVLLLCYGVADAESLASLAEKEKKRQEEVRKSNGPSIEADNYTLEMLDKEKTPIIILDKPGHVDRFEKKLIADGKKQNKREEIFTQKIIRAEIALSEAQTRLEELKLIEGDLRNKMKKLPGIYSGLSREESLLKYSEDIEKAESRVAAAEKKFGDVLKEAVNADIAPGVIREARQATRDKK